MFWCWVVVSTVPALTVLHEGVCSFGLFHRFGVLTLKSDVFYFCVSPLQKVVGDVLCFSGMGEGAIYWIQMVLHNFRIILGPTGLYDPPPNE